MAPTRTASSSAPRTTAILNRMHSKEFNRHWDAAIGTALYAYADHTAGSVTQTVRLITAWRDHPRAPRQ
jgi:hypothetical protein